MSCNQDQDMWVNGTVDDVFSLCLFFSFSFREHGYLFSRTELMSICAQAFFSFFLSSFFQIAMFSMEREGINTHIFKRKNKTL
jgi:hypothetical protein